MLLFYIINVSPIHYEMLYNSEKKTTKHITVKRRQQLNQNVHPNTCIHTHRNMRFSISMIVNWSMHNFISLFSSSLIDEPLPYVIITYACKITNG